MQTQLARITSQLFDDSDFPKGVCVLLLSSFREMGPFYFKIENRRGILNTTLMTRTIAHKQSLTIGSKHKHHIQLLGTMQMSRQQPE